MTAWQDWDGSLVEIQPTTTLDGLYEPSTSMDGSDDKVMARPTTAGCCEYRGTTLWLGRALLLLETVWPIACSRWWPGRLAVSAPVVRTASTFGRAAGRRRCRPPIRATWSRRLAVRLRPMPMCFSVYRTRRLPRTLRPNGRPRACLCACLPSWRGAHALQHQGRVAPHDQASVSVARRKS